MKIKVGLITAVLAFAPGLAIAECGWGHKMKEQVTMSCADGMIYDAAKGTCVTVSTS